ncbi:MAG: benzoyl-CoA 2,3-epoxidase subunit BoxB, partial [Alphaproteobacteria bacterium]
MTIDYNERIPNNVDLGNDRRLLRALEKWQPAFLRWWDEMGPVGAKECQAYLRTAIGADTSGWTHFDHVRMADYRWGLFLAAPEP